MVQNEKKKKKIRKLEWKEIKTILDLKIKYKFLKKFLMNFTCRFIREELKMKSAPWLQIRGA